MAKEKPPKRMEPSGPLMASPFAGLADRLGAQAAPAPPAAPRPPPAAPRTPERAVVRIERKGRGGKEVTVVEQLALRAPELATWLKELKQGLGTGGTVEGQDLVVQGDHRERVRAWLLARGVKKVSVG